MNYGEKNKCSKYEFQSVRCLKTHQSLVEDLMPGFGPRKHNPTVLKTATSVFVIKITGKQFYKCETLSQGKRFTRIMTEKFYKNLISIKLVQLCTRHQS